MAATEAHVVDEADELLQIWEIAHGLVSGQGPPDRLENSGLNTGVRNARRTFGRTRLAISLDDRKHTPLVAMTLAGFILFAFDFEVAFHQLGLSGDLVVEYQRLAHRFGGGRTELDRLGGTRAVATLAVPAPTPALAPPARRGLITVAMPAPPPPPRQLASPPARPQLVPGPVRPALPSRL